MIFAKPPIFSFFLHHRSLQFLKQTRDSSTPVLKSHHFHHYTNTSSSSRHSPSTACAFKSITHQPLLVSPRSLPDPNSPKMCEDILNEYSCGNKFYVSELCGPAFKKLSDPSHPSTCTGTVRNESKIDRHSYQCGKYV